VEHNTEDDSRDLEITVYHSKFGGGKQFLGKLYIDLRGNFAYIATVLHWRCCTVRSAAASVI
jgi:hypothetical protein